MNTDLISFQTVLDTLLDDKRAFPHGYLREFSDIGSLELKTLLDVWPRVDLRRRHLLLEELKALAEADTLVSFDDFARALLTDPDPVVRRRAISLLDEAADVKLLPTYLDMLRDDSEINVRREAANVLNLFVDLGELEEIPENVYRQVEDALLACANSEDDVRVRRAALESLGYSSRPEVITLIESAFQREDPNWQASALLAMGRSADDRWTEDVLRSLINDDDRIRRAAVQAAGELSIGLARPILLKLLAEEENVDITGAVIWSLSQIGGEDVRTYLENLLDQTEDDNEIEFLEDALDNLAFTEDLNRFDLISYDPDLDALEEDEEHK
ncbi:MAG TPA: HEAT repeat domain-containing protein [Anaerolineales bacterium]|nr:HEAT repeat domain-containing protein [Anaerolineales bacterium]